MVSNEKLSKLRQRYADAGGGDVYDPVFKAAADAIFSEGERRLQPYSGMPTFLDAPHLPLDKTEPDFGDTEIALIGAPMDLGVTNRPGARFGPRAVRNVERIGPFHHVHKIAPLTMRAFRDVGDIPFRSRYSLDQSIEDIEIFYDKVVDAGVIPLCIGGDHSITYPILKSLGRKRPVGMIHIDAHCDTGGAFEGAKFHHGGPFRHAVLDGVLDPERTIQIGIRGSAEYLWEFSYESGMTVVHAEEFHRHGVDAIIEQARAVVGDGPVYISLDVDGIDPAYTPGTGTPEVGGLSPRETMMLFHGLGGLNIIGGDVVEVAPQYDATSNTAQIGAQILFEIASLVAMR